jgi:hypothetical protein
VIDSLRRQQRYSLEEPSRIDSRRERPVSEEARWGVSFRAARGGQYSGGADKETAIKDLRELEAFE